MKLTTAKLTKLVITDAPALDPIHVYAEDIGPGQGSLLVRCFDRAWYAYWGAMGYQKAGTPTTVRQFVMACDAGYITNNLVRGNRSRISSATQQARDERYVERIAEAIQQAFKAQQPRVTKQRQARLERLGHANALIKVISDHGRRFFWGGADQPITRLEMDARGKIWLIDCYRGVRVCIERIGNYETRWLGFSQGGTLRALVVMMRDYIKTGERINIHYIAQDCWGYALPAAIECKKAAVKLPIIQIS